MVTDVIFDREDTFGHKSTVTCVDHGIPQRWSETWIAVRIKDVNDNAPIFEHSRYFAMFDENNSPINIITHVKAHDADEGRNGAITYSILDQMSSTNRIFSIDHTSGTIITHVSFDYEETQQYELVVAAVDEGDVPLTSTATVIIDVVDVEE